MLSSRGSLRDGWHSSEALASSGQKAGKACAHLSAPRASPGPCLPEAPGRLSHGRTVLRSLLFLQAISTPHPRHAPTAGPRLELRSGKPWLQTLDTEFPAWSLYSRPTTRPCGPWFCLSARVLIQTGNGGWGREDTVRGEGVGRPACSNPASQPAGHHDPSTNTNPNPFKTGDPTNHKLDIILVNQRPPLVWWPKK